MSNDQGQHFGNHARYFPIYHYFAFPLVTAYAALQINKAIAAPTTDTVSAAAFAVGVLAAVLASRLMVSRVQDRVIRLEETLRMQRVLPASLQDGISQLTRGQFVALRFAPDEELPDLVQRTLKGELQSQKAIKKAIRNWRGDYLRA